MFIYPIFLSSLLFSLYINTNPVSICSAHETDSKIIKVAAYSSSTINNVLKIKTRVSNSTTNSSTQPSLSPSLAPPVTISPNSTSPTPIPTAPPNSTSPTTSPTLPPNTTSPTTLSPSTISPTTLSPNTTSPTPAPNSTTTAPTIEPTLDPNGSDSYTVSQVFSFMVISGVLVFTFFMIIKFRVHVYFFIRETLLRCQLCCARLRTSSRDTNHTTESTTPLNEVIFDPTDGGGSLRQPLITSNMSMGGSETL